MSITNFCFDLVSVTNNVLLLKFEKKEKLQFVKRRDSLAWLDFFSNWTSLRKIDSVSDYMMIVTKKTKSFYCPLIFFFITIYLDESSVEPVTSEVTSGHGNSKYTGQYKKNTAPNKPARKHKPKSAHDHTGESRSDRSASPDNSSTSGNIFLITVLKIRKFQKQIILFSILPKNEQNICKNLPYLLKVSRS